MMTSGSICIKSRTARGMDAFMASKESTVSVGLGRDSRLQCMVTPSGNMRGNSRSMATFPGGNKTPNRRLTLLMVAPAYSWRLECLICHAAKARRTTVAAREPSSLHGHIRQSNAAGFKHPCEMAHVHDATTDGKEDTP